VSLARLQGVDRSLPIWIASALALVLLMALPLGWLAALSVGSESGPTLAHYRRVFADPALQKALWNTVVLAFWVGLASLAVGAPLAWLTARTDVPGRGLIRGLVLASFVTPPFLGAFAWVMLAGPNAGFVNKLWRSLTGAAGALFNIFSMPGLVFVVTIYTFPYVYIMIANTLALIASDLEEAAAILGAGRLAVARTVTLPMVAPALVSGFILAVLQALALFGSPAILAMPAGFHTITTQIWSFFHFPPKTEMAAAFSMPLLLATALLLLVQKKLLGRRGYAAVGGKGGQRRPIPLGPWRWPAFFAVLAIMACAIFLPYGILAKAAVSRAWAQPLTWDNLTLANFTFTFFEYSATQAAIVNTLELGVMACVGAGLVALLSYITNRRLIVGNSWWRSWPWPPWLSPAWCSPSASSAPTRGRRCSSTAHSGSCSSPTSPRRCRSATRSPTRRSGRSRPTSRTPGASWAAGACACSAISPRPWPRAASSPPGASSSSASSASCRPRSSCSRRRPR